jgi:hypothetical protein
MTACASNLTAGPADPRADKDSDREHRKWRKVRLWKFHNIPYANRRYRRGEPLGRAAAQKRPPVFKNKTDFNRWCLTLYPVKRCRVSPCAAAGAGSFPPRSCSGNALLQSHRHVLFLPKQAEGKCHGFQTEPGAARVCRGVDGPAVDGAAASPERARPAPHRTMDGPAASGGNRIAHHSDPLRRCGGGARVAILRKYGKRSGRELVAVVGLAGATGCAGCAISAWANHQRERRIFRSAGCDLAQPGRGPPERGQDRSRCRPAAGRDDAAACRQNFGIAAAGGRRPQGLSRRTGASLPVMNGPLGLPAASAEIKAAVSPHCFARRWARG